MDPSPHPPLSSPAYRSTASRAPSLPPVRATVAGGPRPDAGRYPPLADLTAAGGHRAVGERIVVAGRVTGADGRPVRRAMIELWQANAAGRYAHPGDTHDAPLDPHFQGAGRVFTDEDGGYRFVSVKPGAYPWGNHANAWRPNHIHFSLFGDHLGARLVTQMYFPGDPLLELDPIFQAVPALARARLVGAFDLGLTVPDWALGYRFDIVLGATPPDADHA